MYGATDQDYLVLDVTVQFPVYQTKIVDMVQISVCQGDQRQLQEDEEEDREQGEEDREDDQDEGGQEEDRQEEDGNYECPEDGSYTSFSKHFGLPEVSNDIVRWAASGFTGSVQFDLYYYTNVTDGPVGQCSVQVQTLPDGTEMIGVSGRSAVFIALAVIAGLLALCTACCFWRKCCRPKQRAAKIPLLDAYDDDDHRTLDTTPAANTTLPSITVTDQTSSKKHAMKKNHRGQHVISSKLTMDSDQC